LAHRPIQPIVSAETNQLTLNRSVITRVLGAVALLLVIVSVGGQLGKASFENKQIANLIEFFYLNGEQNIPAFFAVLLLLFAALLLAGIAVLTGKLKQTEASKWAILSCGFLLMAFDEAAAIHERLVWPIRVLLGNESLGVFYFAWVIPGIMFVLVIGVFFLRFLVHLPAATRRMVIAAVILYLGGAIGFEMLGGVNAETYGRNNLTYLMITTVEESLEMAGVIVFIYALLGFLEDSYAEVRMRFISGNFMEPKLRA
jgi:hypothetical protein